MSEDNKTKFGNMPLGMINKMLVSFIGEDAFLDYCEKYHKDWKLDWQSREAFEQKLKRQKEGKISYHNFGSITNIVFRILDDFRDQYGLSDHIYDVMLYFEKYLTRRLSETAYPAAYPVCETYCLLLQEFLIIAKVLVREAVDSFGKDTDIFNALRFSFFNAKKKYRIVFDKFWKKLKKQKDYNNLNLPNSYTLKNIIRNFRQGKNNVTWKNMKLLLDFFKNIPDFSSKSSLLIEAYLTANIESFIETEIPEAKDALQNIEDCLEKIGDIFDTSTTEEEILQNQDFLRYVESLEDMEANLFNGLEDKSGPIDSALSEILEDHIYLQDEKKAEDFITNVKEIAPEASDFYCNWLRAYIAVAKGEFKNAKKLYNEAFKNIHFAGICAKDFLTQASVLSVFCDSNPDTVRGSIDPEKDSKTPLPQSGKMFWEYGHAIGIFNKPTEDAFLEYVYRKENFFAEFPWEMFFPDIEVNPDRIKAVFIEKIKEKIEDEYNRLSALNKGEINKRLRIFNADDVQRRPPLSMAIWLFDISSDERFLDLIEKWLGLSDPKTAIKELNFNTIADLGETPLNAATMVYKNFCAKNNKQESSIKTRLKKITTYIFGKTKKDRLGIATKRKGIHALQNVIDSCDIDLIKELVKGGLDIDSIRLTPDRVSPVYYTIGRIFRLQDPKRAAITMLLTPENTNWEYADVPGMAAEDKKRNFDDRMNHLTLEAQLLLNEYVIKDDLGDESTYEKQIEKLKEICLWLIDYTKNQDEYKFSNNLGTEWTILTLASETDDIDICRALLKHGADPNISLKTGWDNEIPNTFLHRCIEYEAWHVLEMFLTDFKDEAAETIKKYKDSGKYAPFTFFFEKNKEKRAGFMEKFIKLFESCGADFTISSTNKSEEKPQ